MMNRRKFFSFLPLSVVGVAAAGAKAETLPHPLTGHPMTIEEWRDKAMVYRDAVERLIVEKESMWVEMTCQNEARTVESHGYDRPGCGQKFKTLRVAITPICPKCGYSQDISRPGIRENFMGLSC